MKTVKLVANPDEEFSHDFQVFIDEKPLEHERGDDFSDIPYESTDAWAVYTVLKKLATAGFLTLECDSQIEEWYKKQPRPFTGPPGAIGMAGRDGKCECEERVVELERKVKLL